MDEEEVKEKYMHFKMLQQHIEQLTEQVELLNQQNVELEISQEALQELGKTPLETEVLSSLANGIFIKSSLKDNQKLIVNVGENVAVEKTIPEVIKLLEEQQKETSQKVMEAEFLLQNLSEQAKEVYGEVEKHVRQTEE